MIRTLIIYLLLIPSSWASISILNFNTMCDICKGSSLPKYSQRIQTFQTIIKTYNPDLLSLQEFRSSNHLEKTLQVNKDYKYIAFQNRFISYPDAAIVYKKSLFQLKDQGTLWLGPENGDFSFGWKYALPRILVWAHLKSRDSGKEFIFISTHLDNRIENLEGSAKFINEFINKFQLPIIFAGDTNTTFEMKQYNNLSKQLSNSYSLNKGFETSLPYKSEKDLCYSKKGKFFPDCLVEHIFLSKKHNWSVNKYIIDLTKIKNTDNYPSDHRPFYTEVELLD